MDIFDVYWISITTIMRFLHVTAVWLRFNFLISPTVCLSNVIEMWTNYFASGFFVTLNMLLVAVELRFIGRYSSTRKSHCSLEYRTSYTYPNTSFSFSIKEQNWPRTNRFYTSKFYLWRSVLYLCHTVATVWIHFLPNFEASVSYFSIWLIYFFIDNYFELFYFKNRKFFVKHFQIFYQGGKFIRRTSRSLN